MQLCLVTTLFLARPKLVLYTELFTSTSFSKTIFTLHNLVMLPFVHIHCITLAKMCSAILQSGHMFYSADVDSSECERFVSH